MDYVLGKDCKVYYGAADTALASLTELTVVRSVSLSGETGEADVTTRAAAGWRLLAPTLRSLSADIEVLFKPGDAGYEYLRGAWVAGTAIALAILTGAKDAATSEGPRGNWGIFNFSRTEELEEGVVVSFTAKLTEYAEWVDAGSGS